MAASTMSVFQGKSRKFIDYINKGDISSAIDIGSDMIVFALEQIASADMPAYNSDFILKQSKAVLTHLVNYSKKGIIAPQKNIIGNTDTNESDDPYYQEKPWFSSDVPKLTFKNIIGLQEVKDEFLTNIIAPLTPEYKSIYKKFRGEQMGENLLLYGPPGTGKTHIVRCLAGALNCKIAIIHTSEILASVVGVGEKRMAAIFEQASTLERCIIFFDEIDSIASGRDSEDSKHTRAILTSMLTCMDGFSKKAKEGQLRIIVAATNRPWALDSAIKRGGRFETQIYVPLPDDAAREMFVEKALNGLPCAQNVSVPSLSKKLDGYAGADINAIIRQIVNKPMKREIYNMIGGKGEQGELVTDQDCSDVLSSYINSVTPDMLLRFEAYKANIDYDDYVKLKIN